jgi:hypothetical protein
MSGPAHGSHRHIDRLDRMDQSHQRAAQISVLVLGLPYVQRKALAERSVSAVP